MARPEPWAQFGGLDELGLPSPLAALVARQEAREQRAEEREAEAKRAELEDRAEARLHHWMIQRAQQLAMEGRPFNPADPATLVMGMDEQADRVFAAQDREAARADRRALIDAGLLHVLNVPATEMTPPATPEPKPQTAAQAARSREAGYVRLRVRRFFRDLADAGATHGEKVRT